MSQNVAHYGTYQEPNHGPLTTSAVEIPTENNLLWWVMVPISIAIAPIVALSTVIVLLYQWIICGNTLQILVANSLIVKKDPIDLDRKRNKIINLLNTDKTPSTAFVRIPTNGHILLDGITFTHTPSENRPQKWIVYYSGVGGNYETYYNSIFHMARATGANILVVNYRGIGRSPGQATCSNDIIQDGKACISYLTKLNIPLENILLYGHSLGGGIAAAVAKEYPDVNVVIDRSFESLHLAIRAFVWLPFYQDLFAWLYSKWWDLNSYENLKHVRGKQWVLYATQDYFIHHNSASLISAYTRRTEKTPHCYPLNYRIDPLRSCINRMSDLAMTHSYDLNSQEFARLIGDFLRQ